MSLDSRLVQVVAALLTVPSTYPVRYLRLLLLLPLVLGTATTTTTINY